MSTITESKHATVTDQQIINEFIERQLKHMRLVQDNMLLLEEHRSFLPFQIPAWRLIRRSLNHDRDKLSPAAIQGRIAIAKYWHHIHHHLPVGVNGVIDQNTMLQIAKQHYLHNSHHMDYHLQHHTLPSKLDICEMCCDMSAIAQEQQAANYTKHFLNVEVPKYTFLQTHLNTFLAIFQLLETLNPPDLFNTFSNHKNKHHPSSHLPQ